MLHELILVGNLNCRQAADPRCRAKKKKKLVKMSKWPTRVAKANALCAIIHVHSFHARLELSLINIHSPPNPSSVWEIGLSFCSCVAPGERRGCARTGCGCELWWFVNPLCRQYREAGTEEHFASGACFWILKTSVTLWLWRAYCEQSSHHGEMD